MAFVRMRHPAIAGSSGRATEKAFAEVWQPKGWERADDPPVAGPDVADCSKNELLEADTTSAVPDQRSSS